MTHKPSDRTLAQAPEIRRRPSVPLDSESDNAMSSSEFASICMDGASQPAFTSDNPIELTPDYVQSFSQPAAANDMLLTQADTTSNEQNKTGEVKFIQLVKRMTRFYVPENDNGAAWKKLKEVCEEMGFEARENEYRVMTISGFDKRHMPMKIKANLVRTAKCSQHFIDFRRAVGDGIEFKRNFALIRDKMGDSACRKPVATFEGM